MNRERRLGRGLEALLGRSYDHSDSVATQPAEVLPPEPQDARMSRDEEGQLWLDVASIERNPYQPRQVFDESEIADLADSIREHGVLQPLVVRPMGDGFELIAGERRLRAACAAGWQRVPVKIRDVTDRQMAELAIVENVQRKDLNAIEKAVSFQRYIEEYQCTQDDLASRLHIDRSTIANLIRLLELPQAVKDMVCMGQITQGHARALLPLGDAQEQADFARRIQREGLSVRATEQAVQDHIHALDGELLSLVDSDGESRPAAAPAARSAHLAELEQELRHALGAKVDLKQSNKGRGRITIHFTSHDDFSRLRDQLTGQPGRDFTDQPRQQAG